MTDYVTRQDLYCTLFYAFVYLNVEVRGRAVYSENSVKK